MKYCSRDCQVAHRPKHKKECKRRAAELFDEELFKDPPEGAECPICMLPLPLDQMHADLFTCCGKIICIGCAHAQMKEDYKNGKDDGACAFCRTPYTRTDKDFIDQMNESVERNNANSMEQLGVLYTNGEKGLQQDSIKAAELFEKAGENGRASAYCRLGKYYSEENDMKKAKHYWELGAIGGCVFSRYNLACLDDMHGNRIQAGKHFLICAKAGYELQKVKLSYEDGYTTKDEYTGALRAYQKQHEDRRSAMRDKALVYKANPSLYKRFR